MVKPDIAGFFVYRERIMSLAHAGFAIARREVVWSTADLHHVVRGTSYPCNKVSFISHRIGPRPVFERPLSALLEWQAMAEGAYSANTLRAQKADGAIFQAFCETRGEPYLPADPKTIRAFIDDRVNARKKPATIKRYVGATQDLAALDIDLAAITQAGGWKSTRMPLQYAERINAARSGMARAAAATGRDEPVSEER
jgi:hypothetical protein